MRKTFTLLFLGLITLVGTSSYVLKNSTGIAGQTGSPGEQTCAGGGCHGGGSSASKGVTISATPEFSLNLYMPDSLYQISIKVGATGFSRFGFGCEILDSVNKNAGTIQTAGPGVLFAFSGLRKNATHNIPKSGSNSATFTFQWKAPAEGKATIYVCGNAVNFNGNTSGDIPMPTSLVLRPEPVITPTVDVGIAKLPPVSLTQVHVYPNPSSDFCNVSYFMNEKGIVFVELIDLRGKTIKALLNENKEPGNHSEILDIDNIPQGIYFLKFSVNSKKVAQKLIVVR